MDPGTVAVSTSNTTKLRANGAAAENERKRVKSCAEKEPQNTQNILFEVSEGMGLLEH